MLSVLMLYVVVPTSESGERERPSAVQVNGHEKLSQCSRHNRTESMVHGQTLFSFSHFGTSPPMCDGTKSTEDIYFAFSKAENKCYADQLVRLRFRLSFGATTTAPQQKRRHRRQYTERHSLNFIASFTFAFHLYGAIVIVVCIDLVVRYSYRRNGRGGAK